MWETVFRVAALAAMSASGLGARDAMEVSCVAGPDLALRNQHYVSNRAPLAPSPFVKLPIGAIRPEGWLRHQLELMRDGMTGHLTEISPWCDRRENAWLSPTGEGRNGWEELPYWLKGFGDLGYVLDDARIIAEAKVWIEGVLGSRRPDGYFGPEANRTSLDGKADLWPHMVMLNCLQSYHEATGDPRVIDLMTAFFRYELEMPEADFLLPFWQKIRAGDNLESVYWLYNRTGEPWLLELAEKVHRNTADWAHGIASWHGVNITQGFREPAVYSVLSGQAADREAAERNYQTVMGLYGQVPGGMFGADENAREGFDDPRQGAETCSMVEFMHSFEMLFSMLGDTVWADRCEEVAFNSLPASQPPDLKGLHYLTGANMVQLDKENKSPGLQNGGCMLAYDPHNYRCCQHNVSHGWPYYAEHLWMATPGDGLAAVLYSACQVTARVGAEGRLVTISEETHYPFLGEVRLRLAMDEPVAFPLFLRVPNWCKAARVRVNGDVVAVGARPGHFVRIAGTWHSGDAVTLDLPMEVVVKRWHRNHGSVSVSRGPLTYSARIGERWERYGGTDQWPAYEVFPTTPWNYGLVLDAASPESGISVEETGFVSNQPFSPEGAPVRLVARAKRIPNWKVIPDLALIDELQDSPVRSSEPEERITLIPMGCARLRVSAFPVIGEGPDAQDWLPPVRGRHAASHVHDVLSAMSDGREPANSNDQTIPRFTWWDHRGTEEWVTYGFEEPREVGWVEVYWFDDTGVGQCRTPESWWLEYRDGDDWKPVAGVAAYGTAPDQYNRVEFEPVTTDELRVVVRLKLQFSGGVLEWRVGP